MTNGTCVTVMSHRFYRLTEVKCRGGVRMMAVRVKLQEPYGDDFCGRCGILRKDVKTSKPKKSKIKEVESVN